MELSQKIDSLPASPGVYIMKGKGIPLYIGKAKNLRARVRSYFRETTDGRHAIRYLISRVDDVDYIVTSTEKEALMLEHTLLKTSKPRYNIRLKDDKTYISIKITANETFPRILAARRIKQDGARYFGPYASARMAKDTIKFSRKLFPLCVCSPHEFRNRIRPCLDYQLGLCSAPAAGFINAEAYGELVKGAVLFLEGKKRKLIKLLKEKMSTLSRRHLYEDAAKARDQLRSIEATLEEQKVVSAGGIDKDIFGICADGKTLVIEALFIRDGRLVSARPYEFPYGGLPMKDTISSFLSQFYRRAAFIPDKIIIPVSIEDKHALEEWLAEKKGGRVVISSPRTGRNAELLNMAEENAREAFKKSRLTEKTPQTLEEIKKQLHLKTLPRTIEAFDISNIGGAFAVGAMVVFKDAAPQKDRYRLYKIRLSENPDDYAMFHEVLSRRYRDRDNLPDLILIDGGKGQLGIAQRVMESLGIKGVDMAALAKEKPEIRAGPRQSKGDRIYLVGRKDPIPLKGGAGDLLLIRLRDEAHRFAVKYHRKLRGKTIGSVLESIPGIGGKIRRALFERFSTLEGIKDATIEELTELTGITEKLARSIKEVII